MNTNDTHKFGDSGDWLNQVAAIDPNRLRRFRWTAPTLPKAVRACRAVAQRRRVNRPYQNIHVLDMISRCHACCANNLITQRISPAASALSISSRFAVTRAEQINFAMKEFQKCCLIPLAFITNATDGIWISYCSCPIICTVWSASMAATRFHTWFEIIKESRRSWPAYAGNEIFSITAFVTTKV